MPEYQADFLPQDARGTKDHLRHSDKGSYHVSREGGDAVVGQKIFASMGGQVAFMAQAKDRRWCLT
jgi:hypothetical protein